MKLPLARFLPRRSSLLALVAIGALLFAGCISTDQVKSIVDDSNYQMLLAAEPGLETGGLAANPDKDASKSVDAAAARIEAFLAQHQDDPAMASALHFREALLYLSHRSFALADNAFAAVKPELLHSTRDRALFAAHTQLRWWSEYSQVKPATFYATQKETAEKAMAALAQQSDGKDLAGSPDLRDYLLEMRAWIGVKLGLAIADPDTSRRLLQDAVDPYAANFSPAELALLVSADFKNVQPFALSTRRVIRAGVLLTTIAQATAGAPNAQLTFAPPAFQQFYNALPH